MTAEELRKDWEESGKIDETVAPFYLMEIAAQLAELNATLHYFSSRADGEPTAAMLDIRVNS